MLLPHVNLIVIARKTNDYNLFYYKEDANNSPFTIPAERTGYFFS